MSNIIVLDKDAFAHTELYDNINFQHQKLLYSWQMSDKKWISIFGSLREDVNNINKSELPPPLDKIICYGNLYVVLHNTKEENNVKDIISISIRMWESYYEELFGGFESLGSDDSDTDDDEDDSDEYHHPDDYTKEGYLKDSFIADEDDDDDDDDEEDDEDDDDEEDDDDNDYDEDDDDDDEDDDDDSEDDDEDESEDDDE